MSRKALILIVLPVLIVLIAALAVPALVDVNRYKPQIEARLKEQLGRDVTLGPMGLTLIPLAFRVENAVIADAPEFETGRPFAVTQTLSVRPKLLPLIRGDIRIRSLALIKPSVELVRNGKGAWNFATLGTGKNTDEGSVYIGELKIQDGQVAITDVQQHTDSAVYDHIDLTVRNFAPNKPFSVDGQVHIQGSGTQVLTFNGNGGPLDRDVFARTPFHGKLQLEEVSLAALQRVLNVAALENSDAVLTGSIDINNDAGVLSTAGTLEAVTPRIRGVDLGYPVSLRYNATTDLNRETVQIESADLNLLKSRISFSGKVDAKQDPPALDMNVKSSQASVDEVARLAAALGLAFRADTKAAGTFNVNLHASGPANEPALEGRLDASAVSISGGELRQPVRVDHIELSLTPAVIRSNEFTAATGGTTVRARFALSGYASREPQIEATLRTGTAQIEEMFSIARAYGVAAVDGMKGSGTARLDLTVRGPLNDADRLVYSGNGELRNALFNMASLSKPLAIRNADLQFSGNAVTLNNVELKLGETAARGQLSLHNPATPRVQFSLAADKVNVAEWQSLVQTGSGASPRSRTSDSFIRRLTGSGHVTVNTVIYDDLVLSNVDTTVKLDRGVITMNPLTASTYGGRETGSVVMDARNTPAVYNVDLRLQDVDANQLLSSISPIKGGLYGRLAATGSARFNSNGGAQNIVRSLDGRISLNLSNGSIANLDLLHEISGIAQFLQAGGPLEAATKVSHLSGDFDVKDGVARTNNLKASFDAGSFAATGTIDLAQQKLNLRLTTVLSKEYSDAAGGTRIGGFMRTVVANQNGELVIPVLITGTFQHPQVAPDVQRVAEMKLEQLLPSEDNPARPALGILERIFRGK